MTQEQAHQLLTQATGLLQLSREDHQNILEALKALEPAMKEDAVEEK